MMDIQKFSVQYRLLKGLALICCIKDCRTTKSDFLLVQQYIAWTFKTFVIFGDLQEKLQIFYSDIFGYIDLQECVYTRL